MSKVVDLTGLSRFWANVDKRKASTDGKYPDFMAGDLVGRGESVPAEFSFRASGGKSIKDGTAWIKRLKGNSVVWNQLVPTPCATDKSAVKNGVTFTDNRDGSYTVSTDANGATAESFIYIYDKRFALGGHKVLLKGCPQGGTLSTYYFGDRYYGYNEFGNGFIGSYASTDLYAPAIVIKAGTVITTPIVFRPQYIDLTQMFGAGDEPTTIEEFYARKPIVEDEYAYNEGKVIHMTAEGIKSVGDNAWDEEWESGRFAPSTGLPNTDEGIRTKNSIKVLPNENYWCSAQNDIFAHFYDAEGSLIKNVYSGQYNYLPIKGKQFTTPTNAATMTFYVVGTTTYKNDILISLYHSGWKQDTDAGYQPYWEDRLIFDQRIKDEFPDGMKSAGTAHDVAYNDMNKGVGVTETKIGVVDMGDLNWEYISNDDPFFRVEIPLKRADVIQGQRSQLICAIYSIGDTTYYSATKQDKTIYESYTTSNERFIYIKDSAYTDAATFKAAMAGVMLYYELAEPTIIEYDEPFNLDYKVADFGTEQAIAEQPSAPISADIIYQFNAVDMIREHEIEINELQSIIATMQAQLASLTSNNG